MTSAIPLRRALLPCVLAACQLAYAGPVPAASPDAPVPPTRYQPGAAYRPPATQTTSPDQAWKEQNRIVAAQDATGHTMPGHGQQHGAHAGHAMPAPQGSDPHAGHVMPGAPPADPHAEHRSAPASQGDHAQHGHHGAHQPAAQPAPAPARGHEGHH